jgi:hypothetical protein
MVCMCTVQPLVHGDTLLTFSDAEEQLERAEQLTPYQDALEQGNRLVS